MTGLGKKIEALKSQAAACRRAAARGNRASPYLIEMAARYEREAADLGLAYAGNKPGPQPPAASLLPAQLRENAAQCIRLAASLPPGDVSDQLAMFAVDYLSLAAIQERRSRSKV